jgi:hypothetical protein
VLNGLRGIPRGEVSVLGHAAVGDMAALGLALVGFGVLVRVGQRRRA